MRNFRWLSELHIFKFRKISLLQVTRLTSLTSLKLHFKLRAYIGMRLNIPLKTQRFSIGCWKVSGFAFTTVDDWL